VARVGLMLYTIRDECERDLAGTLRRVAELGYDGVEFWQLHGNDPAEVRGWLDELGLAVAGRHTDLEELDTRLPQLADELQVLGTNRAALGWIEPSSDALARVTAAAENARAAGIDFGFHNHAPEVQPLDGGPGTFLDRLRELPHELLWLELDLGWVWHGGADPIEELAKTKGRCPLVHVKDFRNRETREDVPVGDGSVGYERVLPAAVEAGAEWLLVEEDDVEGPPFEAVERSLQAVRRMLADAT
jgi:sugar phosphate isomerase/epimerase